MASTFDIAVFEPGPGFYEHSFIIEDENEALIYGPEKVAQKFLMRLMNGRGTVAYRGIEGCVFADSLRHGGINTESDVYAVFSMSLLDIKAQMDRDVTDETPENEQFASAEITGMQILPGKLMLEIVITTVDGSSADLTIPIEFFF
jgi:hypothetical protein